MKVFVGGASLLPKSRTSAAATPGPPSRGLSYAAPFARYGSFARSVAEDTSSTSVGGATSISRL